MATCSNSNQLHLFCLQMKQPLIEQNFKKLITKRYYIKKVQNK